MFKLILINHIQYKATVKNGYLRFSVQMKVSVEQKKTSLFSKFNLIFPADNWCFVSEKKRIVLILI